MLPPDAKLLEAHRVPLITGFNQLADQGGGITQAAEIADSRVQISSHVSKPRDSSTHNYRICDTYEPTSRQKLANWRALSIFEQPWVRMNKFHRRLFRELFKMCDLAHSRVAGYVPAIGHPLRG
jgi:hypothetical protein